MTTRRTYLPVRLDFAPFVGVALLLIVFFVFTKAIQRPVIMGVTVPTGCHKYESPIYPKKLVTLFLLDHSRVGFMQYRHGDDMAELQQTDFRPEGIRKLLATVGKSAAGDVAVVIKPTRSATFGNVSDALKELKLAGNLPYLLVAELNANEQRMLSYYEQIFVRDFSIGDTVFLKVPPYYRSLDLN
ncbi:biopolymer transporter ExbD [Spirosoma sp. HMF4905]|uniref:Biopolymer transporter ExbD n=1 Tax=Spirosoma arboris TaxID=2682092 RepID=A0A7K1SH39_9BACT|nr:biopolymer transporter ExbD [Spirosoma arboris]MVM33028.1 biopolymer transporter ExbD [Spirosoma arboris]